MSRTIRFLAALVLATAAGVPAWAQPINSTEGERVQRAPNAVAKEPPTSILPSSGLSDWIAYRRDLCCLGPVEGPHRMGTELFVRSGVSSPLEGTMGSVLGVGWGAGGGARFLCYDLSRTGAWTVEFSLMHFHNDSDRLDARFPLRRPVSAVGAVDTFQTVEAAVRSFNRTFVSVGLGREYFLIGDPGACNQWRIGADGGGRYGSAKADFFYFLDDPKSIIRRPHLTDVIAGAYAAVHTDIEFPIGCCTCFCGARCEWAYTWCDILQQQSDMAEINSLVNFGVRY